MERDTAQRRAIKQAFADAGRPLGPQEVLAAAAAELAGLGIATVYRTIKGLLAEGWLSEVQIPGDASRYEMAGLTHHHHFACRSCQRVFDIPGCAHHLEARLPAGFTVEAHDVMLYGTCDACAVRGKAKVAASSRGRARPAKRPRRAR
ncbi:MAG TPA: transcriptional repressor [Planctomycetota bacterium]|nr:transcriptional repressor [Planctomycetota bacterium]